MRRSPEEERVGQNSLASVGLMERLVMVQQVSDSTLRGRHIRRTVLVHSVVSPGATTVLIGESAHRLARPMEPRDAYPLSPKLGVALVLLGADAGFDLVAEVLVDVPHVFEGT